MEGSEAEDGGFGSLKWRMSDNAIVRGHLERRSSGDQRTLSLEIILSGTIWR